MTISDDGLGQYASDPSSRSSWGRVILGIVMLVAGSDIGRRRTLYGRQHHINRLVIDCGGRI